MAPAPDAGTLPRSLLARVGGFVAGELALVAALHLLGGPAWVALGVLVCCGQVVADFRVAPLALLAPAVGWAAWHHVSGNRELFFPYAMSLAAHAAGQFAARGRTAAGVAGGTIVAAFLLVRALQRATAGVLAVESVVAAVILAVVVAVQPAADRRPAAALLVAALASLTAYLGLSL